jgi:hypothetical protein
VCQREVRNGTPVALDHTTNQVVELAGTRGSFAIPACPPSGCVTNAASASALAGEVGFFFVEFDVLRLTGNDIQGEPGAFFGFGGGGVCGEVRKTGDRGPRTARLLETKHSARPTELPFGITGDILQIHHLQPSALCINNACHLNIIDIVDHTTGRDLSLISEAFFSPTMRFIVSAFSIDFARR